MRGKPKHGLESVRPAEDRRPLEVGQNRSGFLFCLHLVDGSVSSQPSSGQSRVRIPAQASLFLAMGCCSLASVRGLGGRR